MGYYPRERESIMDVPTRVGMGGTALFTLAGLSAPLFSWWVSAPIMASCAGVALWGFWPALVSRIHRLPVISVPLFNRHALDKVPITELMKTATSRGWSFTGDGSLHLLDLQKAIRQGGSDSNLTVWGRLNRWSSEELLKDEILEKISPDHWRTFYVFLFPALDGDNFHTKSWTPSQTPQNYLDLHVNRREAERWLRRDAETFKGKTTSDQRGMP
jgi:hypothetical protein